MQKKYWSLMALSAVMLLAACGKQSSSGGKTQTIARMSADVIATMDTAKFSDGVSSQAMSDTMAGLYRYKNNKLTPDMAAKRATVSKDQKTYTFHLRKNIRWSDGKTVTAEDFVYAWQRVANPATKSPYAYILSGIKNADAILTGKAKASSLGVKAIDKHTFQVTLEKPMPYFESMICLQTFDPVEKSVVEKYGSKYATSATKLTFNGPYILKNWNGANNSWTETKNPRYWNASQYHVQKLKYQVVKDASTAMNLYSSGKLDDVTVTGDDAQQSKNDPGYNVVKQSWLTYLSMNKDVVPAFGNVQIQRALSLAINRSAFIKQVLGDGSTPARSMVPTNMMYNEQTNADFGKEAIKGGYGQYTAYDLKQARQLFKDGMAATGTTSLNFTLVTSDSTADKNTATYLQSAFAKLATGNLKVNVTIKSVPQKNWLELGRAHEYGMLMSLWGADYPDASNFLNRYTTSTQDFSGAWSNTQYDQYISDAAGKDATNSSKRWRDLMAANRLITKDMGSIPLYQWGTAHLTKTSVKGMTYEPNSMFEYTGATNK